MTAQRTIDESEDLELLERKSGIPPKGKLGASRGELVALLVAAGVLLLIALAFWWQATR